MGQIKNIKLHIVTDIKVTLKSVVSCYTAKVQTEQLTLTKWPIFQLLNLLACTVLSFCMMTTSTSLVRRWPKSSLLQKSMWKLSGLDSSQKLFKDATLEILSATLDLLQLLVVLHLLLLLPVEMLQLQRRRKKKRRKKNQNQDLMTTWDLDCLIKFTLFFF